MFKRYGKPEFGPRSGNFESPLGVIFKGTGALILLVLGGLFLLVALYFYTCTRYVKPDEFGVKQVYINLGGLLGSRGVHQETYQTGYRREIFGCERIYTYPKDMQVLTFKADQSRAEEDPQFTRFVDAANIQTSDGFQIELDVSILYHLENPYLVLTSYGPGRIYEENGLIQRIEPLLKATLGVLNPEDFFNSQLRVSQQAEVVKALNREFNSKGIKIDHVLIRFPHYNPVVQQKIEERNLQEQTKYMNVTLAAEAETQSRLTKVIEEGKAAYSIVLTNGANYVTRKRAEMEKYDRIKRSEADKLKNLAEAEKTRLLNEAYEGAGSDRVVAMEMAEVLLGLDTILVPVGGKEGFNPLDLEAVGKYFQINTPTPTPASHENTR